MTIQKEKDWLLREKYHGKRTARYFNDLERLERNEPIDYIIGNRTFLGAKIDLSLRPLIPREETEFWMKNAIEKIQQVHQKDKKVKILDLFAGSGCMGIALLKHVCSAYVDFSDNDPQAIRQIQKNISLNKIKPERTHVFRSDIFKKIPAKKYDYIFANPPYIPEENFLKLDVSVRDHEPKSALIAKEKGLFYILQLLKTSANHLKKNGMLFIEFDASQKEMLAKKLKQQHCFKYIFTKDQFGRWRTLQLRKI